MNSDMDLAERLKARRMSLGMTQDTLADKVRKVDPSFNFNRITVSQIENGIQSSMKDKMLLAVSKVLACRPEWLVNGTEPISEISTDKMQSNIEAGPQVERTCPLISWVQAGAFTEIQEPITPDDYEYYPCPVRCGENTFILRVVGDSMTPRFDSGDLIYIDPEQKEIIHNKFVVAQLEDSPEATFKQLQLIDGKKYLVALNPSYPPELKFLHINGNCRIVGTIVAHVKPV